MQIRKFIMLSKLNNKPYTLKTTLKPNQIYSCFGIKIKVKEQIDTFSNKGNFSTHINNINQRANESNSRNYNLKVCVLAQKKKVFCRRIHCLFYT